MAPPKLRFQTKELGMWIMHRYALSGEQQDLIQKIENCFRSVGIGESDIAYMLSDIAYMFLYPNRWVLVNRMKIPATGDILKYHKLRQTLDM
jgi:hypothetical protein